MIPHINLACIALIGPLASPASSRSPSILQELAFDFKQEGVECFQASFSGNRYWRVLDMAWTIIMNRRRLDGVLMQVFSYKAFIAADIVSSLTRLFGIPLVFMVSGGAFPEFLLARTRWVRRVLARANSIITPSHFVAEAIRPEGFNVTVIPHALRINLYPFQLRTRCQPRLAWLRAFHSIYNPVDAVEAIVLLRQEFPEVRLSMMGPDLHDGSSNAVVALIRKHDLADRITTPGKVGKDQVPQRLAEHDIYLNTTSYESFGVAVMEAAALGMCIVTTDVGELPHIWKHEHNALLVAPNKPDQIAAAARRILTEPGLAERLSRNARATAEQYEWSVIQRDWASLVFRLLKEDHHSTSHMHTIPMREVA